MSSTELDKDLLAILACPETKEPVTVASAELVAAVNAKIGAGELKQRDGETVAREIDGGLVRQDGKVLYAVRGGIPIMLIDESISLDQVPQKSDA